MAKKRNPKTKPTAEVVEQAAHVSFRNLGLEWRPKPDGSAELFIAYDGPLATHEEVIARAGTWREGSGPWAETRELPLHREGKRWIGSIPVSSGPTVRAVEFVFRANDEWDNGGRAPLGYYEWKPQEQRVEVR